MKRTKWMRGRKEQKGFEKRGKTVLVQRCEDSGKVPRQYKGIENWKPTTPANHELLPTCLKMTSDSARVLARAKTQIRLKC